MKKVLFIDRDGTLIIEPQPDQQVDSFEKLAFLPNCISNAKKSTMNWILNGSWSQTKMD